MTVFGSIKVTRIEVAVDIAIEALIVEMIDHFRLLGITLLHYIIIYFGFRFRIYYSNCGLVESVAREALGRIYFSVMHCRALNETEVREIKIFEDVRLFQHKLSYSVLGRFAISHGGELEFKEAGPIFFVSHYEREEKSVFGDEVTVGTNAVICF